MNWIESNSKMKKDHNELREGRNLRSTFKHPSIDRIERLLKKKEKKKALKNG